jgi:hypothetical protein
MVAIAAIAAIYSRTHANLIYTTRCRRDPVETADRVRQILSTRDLTLYRVSKRSAEIFGRSSLHFVPQRLYHELALGVFTPNLHQLVALSRISNYRLSDWLAVFGFRLDDIPKLQLLIPWRRTVLLDSSVYDLERWISWFAERFSESPRPAIAPLGQFVKRDLLVRAKELLALSKRRFLYVKVGRDDMFAFPTLVPGSIARIDIRCASNLLSALGPGRSKSIFLVENGPSLNCGHLRRSGKNRITLCSPHFPFTQAELTLDGSVRILGLVDAEIRPSVNSSAPEVLPRTSNLPRALVAMTPDPRVDLRQLVRISRMRVGVSFREASAVSRWIARTLTDPMYFAAAGTLSDYENVSSPLRHLQKIISLCILYCIDFWSFLRAAGIPVEFLGNDPVPDPLVPRVSSPNQSPYEEAWASPSAKRPVGFLSSLVSQWEEVPIFIRSALPALTALKDFSLSDIFCFGGNQDPIHPTLVGASLLAVNRRIKVPVNATAPSVWEQPLYIILLRDGSYLCGSCELRRGVLVVHPHSERPHGSIELRNGIDAEVIGQVTTILRRLS